MHASTPRSQKLQLTLTRHQAAGLHRMLTVAGESDCDRDRRADARAYSKYLEWRAIRKWGLTWRDQGA